MCPVLTSLPAPFESANGLDMLRETIIERTYNPSLYSPHPTLIPHHQPPFGSSLSFSHARQKIFIKIEFYIDHCHGHGASFSIYNLYCCPPSFSAAIVFRRHHLPPSSSACHRRLHAPSSVIVRCLSSLDFCHRLPPHLNHYRHRWFMGGSGGNRRLRRLCGNCAGG